MGGVPLINKDRKAGCVIRSGMVLAALHLVPKLGIDDREHRIAFGPQMNMGDDQAIGLPDRMRVELGSADHRDRIG